MDTESKRDSLSPISATDFVTKLSFTHIVELLRTDTPEKRDFYAAQCISGGWSVRELKRQIGSLLYERCELSTDKRALNELTLARAETQPETLVIRDPFIFEFLGLHAAEVMSESHLEEQLLGKLQDFLLELGQGFCFEARQKRILIGETHNFWPGWTTRCLYRVISWNYRVRKSCRRELNRSVSS